MSYAAPAYLVGGIVGTGSTTGSNQLTITLTEDVVASDEFLCRGLMIVVASSEAYATAPWRLVSTDQALRTPTITDSLVNKFRAPYYDRENAMTSPFHAWTIYRYDANYFHLLRGAWDYILYNPLSAGDTITIDYSHAPDLDWLSANIHVIHDLHPDHSAWLSNMISGAFFPEGYPLQFDIVNQPVSIIQPDGSSIIQPNPDPYWTGQCLFFVCSFDDDDDFSVVISPDIIIPNREYILSRSGVFSVSYSTFNFGVSTHRNGLLTVVTTSPSGYFHFLMVSGTPGIDGAIPYPSPNGPISMKAVVH